MKINFQFIYQYYNLFIFIIGGIIIWTQHLINTSHGSFEFFKMGTGAPLCITHQYIEFNNAYALFTLLVLSESTG
ncbi:hypothetical protein RST01_03050 [Rummeliibacillus stabekisii]|nr:hypothetical protein RST01_03050 [Rummeliibacillus stabekisii]